jgi:hemerythrin-like domain-containing protein
MTKLELLSDLQSNLDIQMELCDKLEELADSLPDEVDTQNCLHLARSIYPILQQAHTFEENRLFPHLLSIDASDNVMSATLERLRFEHWEDESFAEELRECMTNFARYEDLDCINVLAYMLRGFFEGLRRHIAFEREHIAPLLL